MSSGSTLPLTALVHESAVVRPLCSRTSLDLCKGIHGSRRWKEGLFLLALGWIPILAWTVAQFVHQD